MPQRLTVAGEATARSWTSNTMRMVTGFSLIRSPLGRHSVQLSSSTVCVECVLSVCIRGGVSVYVCVCVSCESI
jgi:hypothetical protein